MVSKVFEPLKFYCIMNTKRHLPIFMVEVSAIKKRVQCRFQLKDKKVKVPHSLEAVGAVGVGGLLYVGYSI